MSLMNSGMPDGGYGQNSPFQDIPKPPSQNLNNAILQTQNQNPPTPNTGVAGNGFPTDPSLVSFRNPSSPRMLGDPHGQPPATLGSGLFGGLASAGVPSGGSFGPDTGGGSSSTGLMSAIAGGSPAPGAAGVAMGGASADGSQPTMGTPTAGVAKLPTSDLGNTSMSDGGLSAPGTAQSQTGTPQPVTPLPPIPTGSSFITNPNDPVQSAVAAAYQKKGITPSSQDDFNYWVDKINSTGGGWSNPDNQNYWLGRMAQSSGGVGDYSSSPDTSTNALQLMQLPQSSQSSPLLAAIMQSLQKPAQNGNANGNYRPGAGFRASA